MPPPVDLALERAIRRNTVILGSLAAAAASGVLFVAVEYRLVPLFFAALVALGLGLGTVNLARVGAADMAPPDKRASRVGRVLLGAAVGAILGPIVFSPLLSNRIGDPSSLAAPWIVVAALAAIGAGVVLGMRRDPLSIARELGAAPGAAPALAGRRSLPLAYTDPP